MSSNESMVRNDDDFQNFLHQVHYFEKLESYKNFKGVKGRTQKHIDYWKNIGANQFVIDTISNGYVIPFLVPPTNMYMKNNHSAILNATFVDEAISDLVESGCAYQVPFTPFVVNPLSVAKNKVKKRLILDLSVLNKHVKKEKFKFEDYRIALQLFKKDSFLFKFDLKSGYHHIDICPQQQTFLGFSWRSKFYCFSVLPFGLASSPFIFSKCLKEIVKFWRKNAINIVLYLDDGFGISDSFDESKQDSDFVKQSLVAAGFLVNEKKSIFFPVQKLEWLGIVWNSSEFSLSIPERRISELLSSIHELLDYFPKLTARLLAQVTGRIISLSPVLGNITRLMTRFCYIVIESRTTWDSLLSVCYPKEVVDEILFWKHNVEKLNLKVLANYSIASVMIFSDASCIAAGAYTVEVDTKNFHKMWKDSEKVRSSTWRELKAIEQALLSFKHVFKGKCVKWYTDNKNCVQIVKAGSTKEQLQKLALSIFSTCTQFSISLDIVWVPRTENTRADYVSKMIDHEDWKVSDNFFHFIDSMWGPHSVDRFASSENKKLLRFNSLFWNPESEGIDAFTQNWNGDNNWLVPPISAIVRVIKHVLHSRALGTLIVPRWVSSPFWPWIFSKDMTYRPYVKDVLEFCNSSEIYVKGVNSNSIIGSDRFVSPVLAVRLDATDM